MVVVWAAMFVAFSCFLRKDNYSVQTTNAFNYQRHLAWGDVRFDPTSLRLTFQQSKNN